MTRLRNGLIVGLGFFALTAQTLLFREFLTAFESNELGIGSFFGSWLLWVGIGALVGRIESSRVIRLAERLELASLVYLPAFLIQQYVIVHARQLSGVSAFEVFPFGHLFVFSLLANAPISFLTGLLFTLACRWASPDPGLPVARVYIFEALGGCVGGIAVTLLLVGGVPAETVFLGSALVLVAGATVSWSSRPAAQRSGKDGYVLAAIFLVLPLFLLFDVSGWWCRQTDRAVWRRLLPPDEYRGRFTTAQARYLYGQREGQFVVMSWGGVSEALPNTEHASEVIALSLAQHPTARKVLVVGPGSLAICLRLRTLPQIETVVWLHPDPDYPRSLLEVLPAEFRDAAQGIEIPGSEIREFLRQNPHRFDLILLNLPDATTLLLNRYWTREFFELTKTALADDGVVGTRLTGAANFMGGELVYLGSSALITLQSVFQHVVLKPGDESWLIASNGQPLSVAPAKLRDRFAGINGASAVYPPDAVFSLYAPDRIAFQMTKYREATDSIQPSMLLNTDQRPKALLFSLMLALRRSTAVSFSRHLPIFLIGGLWIAACPILIYGLFRIVYCLGPRWRTISHQGAASHSAFDDQFLIFATGLIGMSLSIVLMFLYQARFGSLFLYIGLISSLFMLGSCLGGLFTERLLIRHTRFARRLIPVCLLAHLLLILMIIVLPDQVGQAVYAVLFAACGVFVGVYFPIVAQRLRLEGRTAGASGANLEMLDHLGGALGAILSGWVMLPILGSTMTLSLLALCVLVNLIVNPFLTRTSRNQSGTSANPDDFAQDFRRKVSTWDRLSSRSPHPQSCEHSSPTGFVQTVPAAFAKTEPSDRTARGDWFDRLLPPTAYTLAGVAAFVIITSQIVASVETGQESRRLLDAARRMTGSDGLVRQQISIDGHARLEYWCVPETAKDGGGFVFSSELLAKGIYGYGGPVVLAIYIGPDGRLRNVQILKSHETPAYVNSLRHWFSDLPGHSLFISSGLDDVETVSGATMTSQAVLRTLKRAGRKFAATVLGKDTGIETKSSPDWSPDYEFLCLSLLLGLAVALRPVSGVWRRRVFLLLTLVLTGVVLNLQYSTQQVMALLSFHRPGHWLSGSFFLVWLVPLSVLVFGNVYCGYLCPFGALQELIGDLRPKRLATDPEKRVWRYGRAVKYLLLWFLILLFGLTRDSTVLSADPLITIFSSVRDHTVLAMGIGIGILSLVFRRFWCRNLCPAGAFLALLCGVKLIKRFRPSTGPARCDLGVRTASEFDCLCCDRCRHEEH